MVVDAAAWAGVIFTAGVASAINSIAGGGTFLSFPALTGLAHLGEKAANMTSTVGLWPGSAASIVAARADFHLIPRRLLILLSATSLGGGILGSTLLLVTPSATFRLVIPWLLLFATLVFANSRRIARRALKNEIDSTRVLGSGPGERVPQWNVSIVIIQFLIALYGGYFGAGIGVLMLAGLAFTGLEHVHQLNALKVLLATMINGAAALVFVAQSLWTVSPENRIHWPLAAGMVLSSTVGGFLGMHVARRIPQKALRGIILTIATTLTVIYFYRGYFA